MGISTVIAAIGTAAAVAGTGVAIAGHIQQAQAQAQEFKLQQANVQDEQKNETLRQTQMNLDANRKQREILRQQQVARATAVNSATNQGAGQSSGLQGAVGEIGGQSLTNLEGVSGNQQIGNEISTNVQAINKNNVGITGYASDAASGAGMASVGSGLSSLGGELVQNSATIGRVGTYVGSLFNE